MQLKNTYLFFLLFLLSCSTPKVIYDYDSTLNFSSFNTYQIFDNAGEGFNELDVKRIRKTLVKKLKEKGFKRQDNPDFFVDFKGKKSENFNRNTLAIGIGNAGINTNVGISSGIPIDNKKYVEQIIIDFVLPTETQQLFWKAKLSSKIAARTTPEKRIQYLENVVTQILKGYPNKN